MITYKFNYQLISNTCIATTLYKYCNVAYNTPFIWNAIDDNTFLKLIENFQNIDYQKFTYTSNQQIPSIIDKELRKIACIKSRKAFYTIKNNIFLVNNTKDYSKCPIDFLYFIYDNLIEVSYIHYKFTKSNLIKIFKLLYQFNKNIPTFFIYELCNQSDYVSQDKTQLLNTINSFKNTLIVNNINNVNFKQFSKLSYITEQNYYIQQLLPILLQKGIISIV